jgi:hypothetical protein
MLLSMRYVFSLTAARFLCGAAGAPVGGGGGSCLAREEVGMVELLDEELPPWKKSGASVCSLHRSKWSVSPRKPRVRPVGPSAANQAALLSSCSWKARSLPGYATEARNTRFRKTSRVVFVSPHATSCVSQPRRQAQWLVYDTAPRKRVTLQKETNPNNLR